MNLLNKLFAKSNKDEAIQTQNAGTSINLQKVYPRIKGLFGDKYPDPVITTAVLELSKENSPVIKPFADGLGICYMVDKGDSYQVIQQWQLTDTITIEKLHDAALTNMAIAIADKTQVNGDPKNVMMVTNGGNLEATMLLADFLWEQMEPLFNDTICVAIPANDLLFIAGKNSLQGRETLRTLVRKYFDDKTTTGLIVRHIYERNNGVWTLIETA